MYPLKRNLVPRFKKTRGREINKNITAKVGR
jgi:hypothetical protein